MAHRAESLKPEIARARLAPAFPLQKDRSLRKLEIGKVKHNLGAAYREIKIRALGAVALYIAKREFEVNRLMPQKTIEILKGDKLWLQREARNHL
jgi:hypothetical protein